MFVLSSRKSLIATSAAGHSRGTPALLAAPALFGLLFLSASPALAYPNGIATAGCGGCHSDSGFDGDVSLVAADELQPGQPTDFTLTIRESHMQTAGFYVTSGGIGTFGTVTGSGARLASGELVHSTPKTASNGVVEVKFTWTPPVDPGSASITVYAVAANGNGGSSGDRAGAVGYSYLWGCEGVEVFPDNDKDGFGSDTGSKLDCGPSDYWALVGGDCNDLLNSVHPGAPEHTNGRDDDCDGNTDEDIWTLFPDVDGDGFGSSEVAAIEANELLEGYVENADDCDDEDVDSFPNNAEVCDGRDNNCDGVTDEGTFEHCGVGRCARTIYVCIDACVPGEPLLETCNGLDDDCDGETDEDSPCATGEVCQDFRCMPIAEASDSSPQDGSSTDAGAASTSSSPISSATGTGSNSSAEPSATESSRAPHDATTPASNPSAPPQMMEAGIVSSSSPDAAQVSQPLTPGTSAASAATSSSSSCSTVHGEPGNTFWVALALASAWGFVRRQRTAVG